MVIAEDSAIVRAGLAEILADRGHEVVAAVGNAADLLAAVGEHQLDVTVVDVRMPPGYTDEGLRAAIAIRRDHPKTGVLVFSQYIETRYAADLLGAASGGGAAGVGYLLKDRVADVGEFVEALSRVAAARHGSRSSPHPSHVCWLNVACASCTGVCRSGTCLLGCPAECQSTPMPWCGSTSSARSAYSRARAERPPTAAR